MITVITHTRQNRPDLLLRCKKSVAAALPLNGQHLVIESHDGWHKQRVIDAMKHSLVAFVDDDDFIHPDAINLCLEALEKTGLGAACTDEIIISLDEKTQRPARGLKTYESAAVHPRVIHHLCVLRGELIDDRAIDLHEKFGDGIDWFIRQSVVQQHGCVYVPIDGYFWTQHDGQHTEHLKQSGVFSQNVRSMGQAIRSTWPAKFHGRLPTFSIA